MYHFLKWLLIGTPSCKHEFSKWTVISCHDQGYCGAKVMHQERTCTKCGYTELEKTYA